MKYIKITMILCLTLVLFSCGTDNDVSSESIFDTSAPVRDEFDNWLLKNYTDPYNMQFIYKYVDSETNNSYNVIPPTKESARAMAILIKYVWIDAYNEVMNDGGAFMKKYAPRTIFLLGSHQYRTSGERVLGTAEGGLKVTLFGTNELDVDNIFIDQDSPYPNHSALPIDLNYWFFHTMHHEFCHIMTQKKDYDPTFQNISAAHQRLGDWINLKDSNAPAYGFVSGYASSEYNEDFAEIYSTYITHTQEAWDKIIADAKKMSEDTELDARSLTADADIANKLEMLKKYFADSWGLDLDKLREVILRRSIEAKNLDLRTLPNS